MSFIVSFIETLVYYFRDYKTIFIVCGICIVISLLSHINETGFGGLVTIMCWTTTLAVCAVGAVCLVRHVGTDIAIDEQRRMAEMKNSVCYTAIKTTNDMLHEDIDMDIKAVLTNPEESVNALLAKTEKILQ